MAYIGNSPENIQRGRRFVYEFKATAGQTVFSGTDLNNQTLDLLEENEMGVYLNGVRLADSDDYTVSGDTLTLISAASLNDQLTVETQAEIANISSYTRAEADARYINYDGDIVAGDLQISGEVDAGSLIVDTDVLVVDATNDRVGIGTSNPGQKLHVDGIIASSNSGQGTDQLQLQGYGATGYINMNGAGNLIFRMGSSYSEKMRIDASGNLLIGTADTDPANSNVNGTAIAASNYFSMTRTNGASMILNRKSSDGDIAIFRKDGTTVGSIGQASSGFYINGNSLTSGLEFATNTIVPSKNAARIDGALDLGMSANRFSDLWLSGNAYADNFIGTNDTNTFIAMTGGDTIRHFTGGTEKVRIDANGNLILKATSDTGTRLQINGADETSELLEVGITTGHAQFTATHASGGSNSAGFIFRTRSGASGTNEKIRITSSGSLLVAKQAEEGNDVGAELRSNGSVIATVDNTLPMFVNRKNGTGELLRFAYNNATIGSIKSVGGGGQTDIMIGSDATAIWFGTGTTLTDSIAPASITAGGTRPNAIDLGHSNARFKDLYLSGGVYLGGTGSANLLDDYEEGSFTPMTSTLAVVYHARYTKIGNLVTINCSFSMNSGQSRNFIQLPFIPANDGVGKNNATNDSVNNRYAGTVSYFTPAGGSTPVNLMLWHQGNQGAAAYFLSKSSDTQQSWPKTVDNTFGVIGVSFTYQTNQ